MDEPNPTTDPQNQLLVLRIIFAALLFGQLAFLGVTLVVNANKEPNAQQIWSLVVPAFGLFQIGMAAVMRSLLVTRAKSLDGASPAKAQAVVAAHLVPWAVLEGGSLFALVVFFITATPWPGLVVAGGLLVAFGLSAPSKSSILKLYQ